MFKLKQRAVIAASISVVLFACPAVKAGLILDVSYTEGEILSGSIALGLSNLPTTVYASFELLPIPTPPSGPGAPIPVPYPNIFRDFDDIVSANFSIGKLSFTTQDLVAFEMNTDANGVLEKLSYEFNIVGGGIALNFPLYVSGTENGSSFEYRYTTATYAFSQVPAPTTLALFGLGIGGLGWLRRKQA